MGLIHLKGYNKNTPTLHFMKKINTQTETEILLKLLFFQAKFTLHPPCKFLWPRP